MGLGSMKIKHNMQLVQTDGVDMGKNLHASLSAYNNNKLNYRGSTLVKLSSTTKLTNTGASGLLLQGG